MRIAIPYSNGMVNAHFGRTEEFIIFEVDNDRIIGRKIITNSGLAHNHGGLAGLLRSEDVDVVITGGIGGPMLNALRLAGLKVLVGAFGDVEDVVKAFLAGELETSSEATCSGHGQPEEVVH